MRVLPLLSQATGENMENRQNVVADYLKLRNMLNRTNPKSNQKTEVEFRAIVSKRSTILFATLKGVRNPKLLELCRRREEEGWKASYYSGLFALENFCIEFLRTNLKKEADPRQVQKVVGQLSDDLRSLGISR
jgi:hypothetical protein